MSRKRGKIASTLLLSLLVATMRIFTPSHSILAASCVLQGNTITTNCDFAPGTYYYNGTFTVNSAIVVTAGSAADPGQVVIYADDFVINGSVTANGLGDAARLSTNGAGNCGGLVSSEPSGACHAGYGGAGSTGTIGGINVYGSATAPVDLGSGGGDDTGSGLDGGAGGGAVKMATYSTTGTFSLGTAGSVTANGGNGSANQGAGGSGGSVWIDTGTINITAGGFFTASGGNGTNVGTAGGGGGGGGRVAVHYTVDTGVGPSSQTQAYGGTRAAAAPNARPGGAGTIFIWDKDNATGDLIVDDNNQNEAPFTKQTPARDYTFANLIIRKGSKYLIGATNTLTVSSGGALTGGGSAFAQPELWILGTFNAPSEAMTITALNIHQSGTVGTLKYLNFDSSLYSLETATALFSAGRGNRLEGLTVSATSGYSFFSASSTGIFHVDTLTVKSGAVLTHATNTTSAAGIQHQLSVSATTTIDVQSGGVIDVNKKGFAVSEGTGQGGDGTSTTAGGGAYGGDGGDSSAGSQGGSGYGSITQPTDLGSGGGNDTFSTTNPLGFGGGIVKLTAAAGAGTITINGTVTADGGDAQQTTTNRDGGGAGGSVWIDVPTGTVAGSGTVSSDGGDGYTQTASIGSGGGGGGRIAVYYSGSHSLTLRSRGGLGGSSGGVTQAGGAGSVYEKSDAETNGDLTFDNDNPAFDAVLSRHVSPTSLTVKNLRIRDDAHFLVNSGQTVTIQATTGTLTGGSTVNNYPSLRIHGTVNMPTEAMTINGLDVHHTGAVGVMKYLTYDSGIYSLDTTQSLFTAGRGQRLETLTVSGTSGYSIFSASSTGIFYVDTLTVKSGASVTHATNTTTAAGVQHRLHISATTSVDIQSGGSASVSGKGYLVNEGTGEGVSGFSGSGGAHGGNGGQNSTLAGGVAYGSPTAPDTLGSGGGSGTAGKGGGGGGSLRIVAPTLILDGSAVAGAESIQATNTGGGAGGSIWIDVTNLSGTGSVTANGAAGDSGASGGGGRVAIYSTTDSSSLTRQAFGAFSSVAGTGNFGGAGTIYLKDDSQTNGDLIVTNQKASNTDTPQVGTTETYDNLTISTGTRYVIGTGKTLTVNSGGTFTTGGGGKQPRLTIDGTFNPPNATQSITAIDIFHNGTIGTTTNLTYTNGTYRIYTKGVLFSAGPGNRLGALTLGLNAVMSATSDAVLYVDTLTMNSGSILTSASNTSDRQHIVDVSATTSITVNSGALIDVDSLGYFRRMGPGVGQTNNTGGGGAHGGDGGNGHPGSPSPGTGGSANDSITRPFELGSGGGDATATSGGTDESGGGYVKLAVNSGGTITVNGTVTAEGYDLPNGAGGGAGGGILIDSATGTVSGSGTLSVKGGSNSLSGSGGGGGGRIAVYYSGTAPSFTYDVKGGTGSNEGGAGTIYTKAAAQTNGSLIVDHGNLSRAAYTPQTASNTSITFDTITIRKGAHYRVPAGRTLAMPSAGNCSALVGGGPLIGSLTVDGTFTAANATCTIDNVNVHHNANIGTVTALTVRGGSYRFYTPGALFTAGAGNRLGTLTVANAGSFSASGTALFHVSTLTVQSGGILTHASNTTERANILDVSATTSITVDSGGLVNADGIGLDPVNGPGAGTTASDGGGAGHGGEGAAGATAGSAVGATYDSVTQPIEFGSGGGDSTAISNIGSGPGGGAIKLTVNSGGTITMNGTIDADGQNITTTGGGGSGGSVWINGVGSTVTGSGTISVNGGSTTTSGEGGGGGGRIAVYYSGSAPSFTYQAFGGNGGSSTVPQVGGAGTIFTKADAQTNGALTVNNNNRGGAFTAQSASNTSLTVDALTVSGAGYFKIRTPFTLSMASAGSCSALTGGGTNRGSITIDGTFNAANATCSVSGVDITQRATFGVATSLTFTTATYTVSASGSQWTAGPGNRLSALTLGSGATLNATTTDAIYLDTLTIQSGGNATHEANFSDLKNLLTISATTSITVNSGGTIDVIGKGFDADQGPGKGARGSGSGGGGGYGGNGGSALSGAAGGTAYGSATLPADPGSGGGDNTGIGNQQAAAAGGIIRLLSTSGTLTVDGVISASGTSATGTGGGGGSGGTVYIDAGTITQSSPITASGGAGNSTSGGCGGGGRIVVSYASLTTTSTSTAATGCTGARAGQPGSVYVFQSGSPPDVGTINLSPANPEVGHNIYVSATATDDVAIQKIEIYLDGTAAGNLQKTCNISPAATPAACDTFLGALAAGAHTVYYKAYDNLNSTTTENLAFTVADRTSSNTISLSRLKVSTTATATLTFTLNAASTGTLTLTFPTGFTVLSAPTSGSGCLSSFGFSGQTMTATKTACTGTVTMTGGTVTNPSTAGQYTVVWTNDNGSGVVTIVDDDQFVISATVDPIITFNVGTQTAACDGTFSGNGGTLDLGSLLTSAVASSDVSSVPHICTRLSTNASGGAVVTVSSTNSSLKSTATPGDTIPSSTALLVAGTSGYGLCGGSGGSDTGTDSTTPTGASPSRTAPFASSCTTSAHNVGGLTTAAQQIWSVSGPTQNAFVRLFVKAAVSSSVSPHNDYTDVLTFIVTSTY